MKLRPKKIMAQQYECKHCAKKFSKEKTLSTHLCVKKQRYLDSDKSGPRLGYMAFTKFYKISINHKKVITLDDFINSPYYIDFAKFGNHISSLKPVMVESFIDFVITHKIKISDWCKDYVYHTYIVDLVKKEPAESAIERTITEIMKVCESENIEFADFFRLVNANQAAYLIKIGKISPWMLYIAPTGGLLMSRFNEDHSKMISEIIDPVFWMRKFKKLSDNVTYIRNILDQSGI